MADKHPYSPSGAGAIVAAVNQLKKSFPPTVTSETLKSLAIAANNESYIIYLLRFLKAIDAEGKKTPEGAAVFTKHIPAEFQEAFGAMVQAAYAKLFAIHNEHAWNLDADKLIAFFRTTDGTSDIVGRRQASTFQTLASLAGHGEAPKEASTKGNAAKPAAKAAKKAAGKSDGNGSAQKIVTPGGSGNGGRDVGLTVRIEVNLPAAGDQETYDRIFRSIRENLLNAK